MRGTVGRVAVDGIVLGVLVVTATACSGAGDLSIWNDGPAPVSVSTGDEEFDVAETGGVVILDYGCTPGDVTVTFASGQVTVVPGPVCPDHEIVVGDGHVDVRPAP